MTSPSLSASTARTTSPRTNLSRAGRRFTLRSCALAAVVALTACGGSTGSGSTEATESRTGGIALSWIKNYEFSGYFFADKEGYYRDEGFSDVDLVAGGGTTNSWDTVLQGGADIALASDLTGIATAIKQGADLTVVGAQFVRSPVGIVSLSGNPITSVDDMQGKTFGVDSGGRLAIEALLKANDKPADWVVFESVPNGVDPLVDGKVDALVGFLTNYPIAVAQAGADPVVLSFSDAGYAQVGDAVVVKKSALADPAQRKDIEDLMAGSIRGWNYAMQHQDQIADIAMEYGEGNDLTLDLQKSSAAVLPSFMVTPDTVSNGLFTLTDDLQDQAVSSLAAADVSITTSDLFDSSLLQDVYAADPSLVPGLTVPTSSAPPAP